MRRLLLLLLLAACSAPGSVSLPPGTTLIALRHAERTDELLSEAGKARAAALPAALAGVQIDAIYSPGLQRNLDTAAPLAKARGLEIIRIPPTGAAPRLMAENAGRTVVWVGNKGNLTEIWAALNAPGEPPLRYGEMFFVSRAATGAPKLRRSHFGALPQK